MESQNQGMILYFSLIMPILTTNFKIRSCIILSEYQQILKHWIVAILKLEMEMNIREFITNQQKIHEESFVM